MLRRPDQKLMGKTYVMDIGHFLDEAGELAEMPGPARKLASFLVLLIDATTEVFPAHNYDTKIRCRTAACYGSVRASLESIAHGISWHCPECGQNGVINNWQGTKWNQKRQGDLPPDQ